MPRAIAQRDHVQLLLRRLSSCVAAADAAALKGQQQDDSLSLPLS